MRIENKILTIEDVEILNQDKDSSVVLKNTKGQSSDIIKMLKPHVKIQVIGGYDAEKKEYGHYYVRPLPKEENPNDYTDELGYKWKYAHEYLDGRISWRSDGKRFDNFKIEFTIMKENPLTVGSKCTGRYGNKGVCSEIIPDELAPYDPNTGIRAEIILNPLAVVNRLNPA